MPARPSGSARRICSISIVAALAFTLAGWSAPAGAANITWVSVNSGEGADQGFVTLLEGAGHTVTRMPLAGALTADQITQLNASDLVIAGRATNSGDFDNLNGRTWNTQVTAPVIMMSAYGTRRNRLGWASGDAVPDSGPTQVVAIDPTHPVFAGITFAEDTVTTADEYNVMIDRGTTMMGNAPAGGTTIATSALAPTSVAIAEWAAGATVQDEQQGDQVLAGRRYFFAGGSREANGSAVSTAGVLDLTEMGQQLFLNTVSYALVPEPSAGVLCVMGSSLLLCRSRRRG